MKDHKQSQARIQTLVIERIKFAHYIQVSKHIEVRLVEEFIAQSLAAGVIYFLHGKKPTEVRDIVSVPDGPWQAFKDKYFGAFLKKTFHVKTRSIPTVTNRYVICPHLETDAQSVHYDFLDQE